MLWIWSPLKSFLTTGYCHSLLVGPLLLAVLPDEPAQSPFATAVVTIFSRHSFPPGPECSIPNASPIEYSTSSWVAYAAIWVSWHHCEIPTPYLLLVTMLPTGVRPNMARRYNAYHLPPTTYCHALLYSFAGHWSHTLRHFYFQICLFVNSEVAWILITTISVKGEREMPAESGKQRHSMQEMTAKSVMLEYYVKTLCAIQIGSLGCSAGYTNPDWSKLANQEKLKSPELVKFQPEAILPEIKAVKNTVLIHLLLVNSVAKPCH